ncbi:ASCH domain-containing protein [Vagococcus salmoninarum]|uniref:ASCH domain-containing protein n=1 Tax=Vagococcus salmoninarum TaxID=2739 RepID=UPI0028D421A3|nr:ASCH domain-containing protein [Vagococcus salmoninarum]
MTNFSEIVAFGSSESEQTDLAQLVLQGVKVATSSLAELYPLRQQPLTQVGDIWQIQDGQQRVICYVQVTNVLEQPFGKIDSTFALEEGDGSYANWHQIHETYYASLLKKYGRTLTSQTPLICTWFTLIPDPSLGL